MDAFLSELKTAKLRRTSNSFAIDNSFSNVGSASFSTSATSSDQSFSFMPKLRKVITLPNGKKVSELDASGHFSNDSGYRGGVGDESVIVDLTQMENDNPPNGIGSIGASRREHTRTQRSRLSALKRSPIRSRSGYAIDQGDSDASTEPAGRHTRLSRRDKFWLIRYDLKAPKFQKASVTMLKPVEIRGCSPAHLSVSYGIRQQCLGLTFYTDYARPLSRGWPIFWRWALQFRYSKHIYFHFFSIHGSRSYHTILPRYTASLTCL
jgi:hypothetical protein